MDKRFISIIFILLLALPGCHLFVKKVPVTVKIPVPVRVKPPPELLAPFKVPDNPFIEPCDPKKGRCKTTSCLTKQGEHEIKEFFLDVKTRTDAWEVWATTEDEGSP